MIDTPSPDMPRQESGPDDSSQQPQKLTPMFAQYMNIKAEYPDALLFYRMGDFYELFFEDAHTAARELQITLTSRNPGNENAVPMCGVPHHAAENYLAVLLDKGYKVAVCEQIEDPKTAKGLVKRAVTRVLTPGTVVEDSGLEAKGHNYLGAIYWDEAKGSGGFAWVDYSTGEWSGLFSKRVADLWQWVLKLSPRELLIPDFAEEDFRLPEGVRLGGITPVRVPARSFFDAKRGAEKILQVQNVAELGALGLEDKDALVRACGALVSYLIQTQKHDLSHLKPFVPLSLGKHLVIDEISERNLEIFRRLDGKKGQGTLSHVLDFTLTPMGGRMLEERLRHPWREIAPIEETQDAVSYLLSGEGLRERLRTALSSVYDLERLSTRICLNRTSPKDFVALRQSLASLPLVRDALCSSASSGVYATADEASGHALPSAIARILDQWDDLADYAALLHKAVADNPPHVITEGGLFKPGFHRDLDELLDLAEHGEQKLQELLAKEQEETGVAKLRLGFNRVFGYYFETSRSQSENLPERFLRRQSLANAERMITPELKELEERILSASERRKSLEYALFQELRDTLAKARPRILFMGGLLAVLDYWQSLAEAARRWNWTKPRVHDGTDIVIREGRHPVVEAVQGKANFIPNDLRMDEARRLILITGPNMAGKSTVLRQTALMVILAQMGSFVPAAEAAIGLADRIFSRVGASDNLSQGQSTFMVEMMETARILRQAGKKSLVILDEIGRGTSTFDGMALAWAVVEELVRRGKGAVRTLFATHYHELTALEGRLPGVHNMNIAIREWGGEIVFLRRLVPGPADKSYGIEVARLAGVPQSVVQRARQILEALEKNRAAASGRETARAMEQLLPGFTAPEIKEPETLLPESFTSLPHPLLVTLRDLDPAHITPMRALELINEWKLLWGSSDQ
ncbi:DNA mismatch repair protein MutS [uncultured delta proteobacterium]|uniref:DNA mismatch repair protein MutS n=1 Tax=uncultured delta proteobacterium TaxID=34034 RepID=A0A212J4B4_9DELT|nr:DNA mismatch repair protein MutS [uncultured delta proteobacterium]